MASNDGMNYAPRAKASKVCKPGDFRFASIGLDHGHIYGMTAGLVDAGAEVVGVWDPDPSKIKTFLSQFPDAKVYGSKAEAMGDKSTQLIASAAIPSDRGPLGLEVMDSGKHYFSDKAPFTTHEQLAAARKKVEATGLKWAVCYSERVQNEAAVYAGQLVMDGEIGRVLQVMGMGPHRLGAKNRPEWFFKKKYYGGILTDIGSHQIEQFLYYTGAKDAQVLNATVANHNHPEYSELEDFGEAHLLGDNGATNYFRVDWFTPDGLGTWGDGRTFILGTEGYIELRKYIDVARDKVGDQVYLVTQKGEYHIPANGTVGFPYFGALIRDCLDGTDLAMPQEHTFKAGELCLKAQDAAVRIGS